MAKQTSKKSTKAKPSEAAAKIEETAPNESKIKGGDGDMLLRKVETDNKKYLEIEARQFVETKRMMEGEVTIILDQAGLKALCEESYRLLREW